MTTPDPTPAPRHLDPAFYATRPTRWTVFWRTFIPWQMWRFVEINLRMIRIIGISHRGHR